MKLRHLRIADFILKVAGEEDPILLHEFFAENNHFTPYETYRIIADLVELGSTKIDDENGDTTLISVTEVSTLDGFVSHDSVK